MPKRNEKQPAAEDLSPKAYRKLVEDIGELIRNTLLTGAQSRNETLVESYWSIGRRLEKQRAPANKVIYKIAKELRVEKNLLYRSVQLHTHWPDGLSTEAKRLEWAKHVVLGGLKSRAEVAFYVKAALQKGWTRETLRRAVNRGYYAACQSGDVPEENAARPQDRLYLYRATVKDVVDGDTIHALVDLGFHLHFERSLRLRGLNAAELSRPNAPSPDETIANRAKAFVMQKLAGMDSVVIKTHKTDAYGRFVADVFYHPVLTDMGEVVTKGFWLNEELLQAGLAKPSYV